MGLTRRMTNSTKSYIIYFVLIYLIHRLAVAEVESRDTTDNTDDDFLKYLDMPVAGEEIEQNPVINKNENENENEFSQDLSKKREELIQSINEKFDNLKNELNKKIIIKKGTDLNQQIFDEHFYCQENCEIAYKNCEEATFNSERKKGVFLINIPDSGLEPFYAYCSNDWMIIYRQAQRDTSKYFYKDWNHYKKGFGNIFGDHWLGLEKIYAITKNADQELSISLKTKYYMERQTVCYSKFSIGNKNDGYKLSVSDFHGNIGNGETGNPIPLSNGSKFSTYDNDNDLGNLSCERILQGAWWHNACSASYSEDTNYAYFERKAWYELFWKSWDLKTKKDSHKIVQMAIRPRTGKCFE